MSASPGAWRPARGRRWRRRAALALGLLALAGLGWQVARVVEARRSLRQAFPVLDGTLQVAGLTDPVSVLRDRRGIPHVEARNQRDALFALGFVHAQDRFAQMLWLRQAARGETAAWVGAEFLDADRLARTLGLRRHADAEAGRLDRSTARALEAYADGVNARVARMRAGQVAPPLALVRLGVALEDWTPADSLAVSKLLAWGLDGSIHESLVLSDLIERLGGFGAGPFFPPEAADRLLPLPPEHFVEPVRRRDLASLRGAAGLAGRSIGSSAWVVSGARSESGKPLLAADSHREPTRPALYYEAHLRAPRYEVVGATIPGIPVFWCGHNTSVAWATTHARAAVTDLYVETMHPEDPERYHDGRRWRALARREETLRVRRAPDQTLVVRETAHGPLLGTLVPDGREPLAVAWPGARPGNGVAGLLRAAHARNAAEFRAALAAHHEPVVAAVFADVAGGGGMQVAGFVPERAMPTGLVPVPGRSRWYDWRGRVPYEALPAARLDDAPWLVVSDNPLDAAGSGPPLDWLWRTGERTARIEALLERALARGRVGALELAQMLGDVQGAGTTERVARLLEWAGPAEALPRDGREVHALLAAWDGRLEHASPGAAAYHALLVRLLPALLAEPVGPELLERYLRLRTASPEHLLDTLLAAAAQRGATAWELADPEHVRRAVRAGLRETGLALLVRLGVDRERWTWGRLHALRFRPFGWPERAWEVPAGDGVPYAGDASTVALGEYDPTAPFEVRAASVYRFVVDLADLELGLSALAPGASEHPGHPLREAGLAAWLAGRAELLPTHPILIEGDARSRLRLEPLP